MKKQIPLLLLLITLLFTTSSAVSAQEALRATTSPNQAVLSSLSTLPEADVLVYVNPPRILNEAVPKFMPEKDVAQMRTAFEDIRKNVGVDPSKVEYIVIA
ncbi:MAG TPA: hypothetical protein VIB00_15225, partial [Pyrinomonadaceae bacterium]